MSKHRVGVAILGCGYWGINYVRVFGELAESRVVTVCDQRAERLRELKRRLPGVHLTTRADEAIRRDGVEAVVVCTNATTHHDVALQCLRAGKHVLVEKPLTTVSGDADELIELAESQSRVLMVGHTFVYNGGVRKVKEHMKQGTDKVYYLYSCRTNLGPIRQDVDCVWDLATHDVSIMNFLLGQPPVEASARGGFYLQDGKVDVAFITLKYPNDVLANIHVSWLDPKKIRQLTIVGDRKMVTWDDMQPGNPISIYDKGVVREPFYKDFGEFQLVTKEGDVLIPKVRAEEPLRAQTNYFIGAVATGKLDLCGPEEGVAVVRVLEAIQKSMAGNGAPMTIPA